MIALPVEKAADELGVPPGTLRRWIRLLCTSPDEASSPSRSVIAPPEMTPHDANDAESGDVHRKEWTL